MDQQPVSAPQGQVQFESAFKLFRPSMHVIGVNLGTMVGIALSPLVPFIILLIMGLSAHNNGSMQAVLGLLTFVVGIGFFFFLLPAIMAGLTYTELKGTREEHVTIGEAFHNGMPYMWRFLGLYVCLAVIYFVAFLLFIVPFFFMWRRYILSPFYLVDRNIGVFDALKQSAADSKRFSGEVWGVVGVETLIGVVSGIPIIGWIVGVVAGLLYLCAPVVRYRQITLAGGGTTQPAAPAPSVIKTPPVATPPLVQA
jgi:hypothetical protein